MTQDIAAASRLVLDGVLTIRTAGALCGTLREAVAKHSSVSIDCAAAVEADLSFIQLLIAARASARRSDKTVTLMTFPDGPLLDALTRAGFRVTHEHQSGQAPAFWFEGAAA
jgi:ABC-type transporter Mla MlaB component